MSFQCPDTGFYPKGCHPSAQTLGSRNFIKLVSIKVLCKIQRS
ncbi:hypothetical protein [Wolbachia endosymbiont (group A) of Anomoia purmunda]|nr:hypothetical protein [Wolbachia endosymbiont (group A) of Anomoia purmunda]